MDPNIVYGVAFLVVGAVLIGRTLIRRRRKRSTEEIALAVAEALRRFDSGAEVPPRDEAQPIFGRTIDTPDGRRLLVRDPKEETRLREKYKQKIAKIRADHAIQVEKLEVSHSRELEALKENFSRKLKSQADKIETQLREKALEEESRRKVDADTAREGKRKGHQAKVRHILSTNSLPDWPRVVDTLEFLGGDPKFPILDRQLARDLVNQAPEMENSYSLSVGRIAEVLTREFLSKSDVSDDSKFQFLVSCGWLTPLSKGKEYDFLKKLVAFDKSLGEHESILEAFNANPSRAFRAVQNMQRSSDLKDSAKCQICGAEIESGRTRCPDACAYS